MMADFLGRKPFGGVALALDGLWLRLQGAFYKLNLWERFGRGLKLARTGQFGSLFGKLFRRRAAGPVPSPGAGAGPRPVRGIRTGPQLHLAGSIHGPGGYDHLVLEALVGLTDAGAHVLRDSRAFVNRDYVPPEYVPSEWVYDWRGPRLAIVPPYLLYRYRPTATTAAWTMWETDAVPAGSVKYLNRCGLILVPSRWGADCFCANGVTVPLEVVPLGYDPGVFAPRRPGNGPDVCTFGTAGALDEGGMRKNVQRVIHLFRAAFPGRADVRLKVKITPRSPMVNAHDDPRVEVVRTTLSPAALAEWYRSLTCYVNASYGEGFGLHLLEAMGCGVPLISTTFSAVGEVFDSTVGYEVGYRLIEAKNAVYSGRWADPDNDALIARMREVYADRATAERLGRAAARRAPVFSWANSIRALTAALARYGYLPPEFGSDSPPEHPGERGQ